jgi:nitrogen regulatory protein PII
MDKTKPASPIELLVAVCEQNKASEVSKILNRHKENFSIIALGKGTAESDGYGLFGFGIMERDIVFAIINTYNIDKIIRVIARRMKFNPKDKKGIVFTLPVNSIEKQFLNLLQNNLMELSMETKQKENQILPNNKKFDLIITIVNRGFSDYVVDAARNSGASGATIIYGRGTGVHEQDNFFGVNINPEKELILILVHKEDREKIMIEITKQASLNQEGKGLCFSVPVNDVAGVNHLLNTKQVKKLDKTKNKKEL